MSCVSFRYLPIAVAALVLGVGTARNAAGGLLIVNAVGGTDGKCESFDKDGNPVVGHSDLGTVLPTDFKTNNPGTIFGQALVQIGTDAEEKRIKTIMVCKVGTNPGFPPTTQYSVVTFQFGTKTVGSAEPFDYPTFAASTTVVALVDMEMLLTDGDPFTLGQVVNVIGGSIAESAAITFKDGSGLASDAVLNSPESPRCRISRGPRAYPRSTDSAPCPSPRPHRCSSSAPWSRSAASVERPAAGGRTATDIWASLGRANRMAWRHSLTAARSRERTNASSGEVA